MPWGGGGTKVQVPPRGGTEVWVPPQGGYRGLGTPPGGTEVRVPPQGGYQGLGTPRGYRGPGTPPRGGYRGLGTPPRGGYPGRTNRRSTHYTAGGMPLAFTQEDFLVTKLFLLCFEIFFPYMFCCMKCPTTDSICIFNKNWLCIVTKCVPKHCKYWKRKM